MVLFLPVSHPPGQKKANSAASLGCETKFFRPPVSVRFQAKGPPGGTTPGSCARHRAARQRPGRRWPATALACQPSQNCQRSFHWHRTRCGNAGNFGVPPQRLQRAGALRDAAAPDRASRPGSGMRAPSSASRHHCTPTLLGLLWRDVFSDPFDMECGDYSIKSAARRLFSLQRQSAG